MIKGEKKPCHGESSKCTEGRPLESRYSGRVFEYLHGLMLISLPLMVAGCVANAGPPSELLVVTSQRPDPREGFEFRVIQPDHDRLRASPPRHVPNVSEPPLPAAIAGDGSVVALAPLGEGKSELRWIGGQQSSETTARTIPCAQLLETVETRVAIVDRAPQPRSHVKIENGRITAAQREYVTISVYDIDSREQVAVFRDVFPVCRVEPGVWLVARAQPASLSICSIGNGAEQIVAEFEPDRWISGIAVAPNGAWACVASQASGASCKLHRLDIWDRRSGSFTSLLPEDAYVSNRADSDAPPLLSPTALSTTHLAFVVTQVTDWADQTPISGRYATMIYDVPARKPLARISHPQASLSRASPQPYLPEDQLHNLRIQSATTPVDARGFRRYFTLRGDSATGPRGRSYPQRELTLHAAAASNSEFAVRRRFGGSGGSADEIILVIDGRELDPIVIPRVERLTWLPRRPIAPATQNGAN
ncbi:MAG: hypothetical protein JNG88_15080 [Phycisphaerales bacterium]|nr:hypothetical protein [Phycisphaerales bacterium]